MTWLEQIGGWLPGYEGRVVAVTGAVLLLIVGWTLAKLVSGLVGRSLRSRATEQTVMLVRKLVFYILLALVVMAALQQAGLKLGVLLGAAGVLTVAIGFASQTSASNLVSGLFLIAERPFVVGDVIKVADTTGSVLSIDLLSVKLRTFDNLLVRIPNETIIKSEVTNLTHFPIRRFDMQVGVAYHVDLEHATEVLKATAEANALCLIDPEPLIILRGFGESSLDIQFSVWATRENWLAMRNSMVIDVKRAFDAAGIEIPFPHRTLYAGSVTGPLPVRLSGPEDPPAR
jgi:small-conductance mechanosensitive channel